MPLVAVYCDHVGELVVLGGFLRFFLNSESFWFAGVCVQRFFQKRNFRIFPAHTRIFFRIFCELSKLFFDYFENLRAQKNFMKCFLLETI